MKYILAITSDMPPHEKLYVTDANSESEGLSYYQSGSLHHASVFEDFDTAQKFSDEESREDPKHVVITFSDEAFEIAKEADEGYRAREEYDKWQETQPGGWVEDCGCEICTKRIAKKGTYAEQYEKHLKWCKDNPEASEELSAYVKELVDAIHEEHS